MWMLMFLVIGSATWPVSVATAPLAWRLWFWRRLRYTVLQRGWPATKVTSGVRRIRKSNPSFHNPQHKQYSCICNFFSLRCNISIRLIKSRYNGILGKQQIFGMLWFKFSRNQQIVHTSHFLWSLTMSMAGRAPISS